MVDVFSFVYMADSPIFRLSLLFNSGGGEGVLCFLLFYIHSLVPCLAADNVAGCIS